MSKENNFYFLDEKLTNWRIHENSYISLKPTPKEEFDFKLQLINLIDTPLKRLSLSLSVYRRYIIRVHINKFQICLFGKWYLLGTNNKKTYNSKYSNVNFSVIMPTYNRSFCISSAIDSLINQTNQNYELIIIDDGSNDGTENLLKNKYFEYFKTGKFVYKLWRVCCP